MWRGMTTSTGGRRQRDRIFDKIKHSAEKTGRAIEKTAKKAEKAVEHTATDAVGKTQKAAEKAKDAGMNIGGEIQGLINKAGKEINSFRDKAIHEIRDAQEQAQRGVVATGRKVSSELEHTVVDKLPKLIATALSGLASEAMKPGLKGAAALARSMGDEMDALKAEDADLVKAINQCGFKLKIKANVELLLVYNSFYTRVREMAAILDRAGNDGIALRRRDLIGFVESMGPTTVALGGGAEISLGFDLGGSASLTAIPLKLFSRLADRGLKELGVPE